MFKYRKYPMWKWEPFGKSYKNWADTQNVVEYNLVVVNCHQMEAFHLVAVLPSGGSRYFHQMEAPNYD